VARNIKRANAKRADKPNPREDRNFPFDAVKNPHGYHSSDDQQFERRPRKKVQLLPRNVAQEDYIDALCDLSKHIVFAMGPAGTGKSLLATLYAIKALQEGKIEKIIITRPVVSVDEQLGFLPGDLTAKLAPWCVPILDIFKEYFSVQMVEKMIRNEVIELAPLGMMRGRTLKNCILILDEAQNATPNQMKMMLTRIGDDSRMFITGDVQQHDRGFEQNGLKDFVEKLKRMPTEAIEVVEFARKDVERHPVVEIVLQIYGDE
jgi:phosphate starvation-inducible protein PhoH and related proteins